MNFSLGKDSPHYEYDFFGKLSFSVIRCHFLIHDVMFRFFDHISVDCGSIWTFFTVCNLEFKRNVFLMVAGVKMPGSGGRF